MPQYGFEEQSEIHVFVNKKLKVQGRGVHSLEPQ